jgi:hypothetical protein
MIKALNVENNGFILSYFLSNANVLSVFSSIIFNTLA